MKKKTTRGLALSKETLRTLDDRGLRTIGLLSMLCGLAALQLIHWLAQP